MDLIYGVSTYADVYAAMFVDDIWLHDAPYVSAPIQWSAKVRSTRGANWFELQFKYDDIIYFFSSTRREQKWGMRPAEVEPQPGPGPGPTPVIAVFDYNTNGLVPGPSRPTGPEIRLLRADGRWVTPDTTPTADSTNIVTSGGVYAALLSFIDSLTGLKYLIVEELPDVGEDRIIYLVSDGQGAYDEYLWVDDNIGGHFEAIGSTNIDLDNYYTKAETDELIEEARDMVLVTYGETPASELMSAIDANKLILIRWAAAKTCAVAVTADYSGDTVQLHTVELSGSSPARPRCTRYHVSGSTWAVKVASSALVDEIPLIATIGTTTSAQIVQALETPRAIVITSGDGEPQHNPIYVGRTSEGKVYILFADISTDTNWENRQRPAFYAYTVYGNSWTLSDPLEAVVPSDFANIVNELPTSGISNTRYLLKVLDDSTQGYHLDEYLFTESKWICISRDNVVKAIINTTTDTEILSALNARKIILIQASTTDSLAVVHGKVGSGYVDLYALRYDTASEHVVPNFCRYRVVGSTWTVTSAGLSSFVAIVDVTTEAQLKAAIDAQKDILLTASEGQPYHTVVYAENKGVDGAYVVYSDIVTDSDRWNRRRSRFSAYTVKGTTWTAANPIDGVVDADLVNVVTSLPSTGVANTRYLLKVTDASSVGYHLDEYLYRENKWIFISKDKPAPFLATIKVTSQAEIRAAIDSGSPIYIYSDITGGLWPAIQAVANMFTATVRYLTVGSSSGNYTVDIVSNSVVGTTWTPTEIHLALKSDLDNYVPKLATPITASTTNYIRAFQMNSDGLITGVSGTYTKSDTISSSSTVNQLASAKGVRDYVATPAKVSLSYNTSYISANYSTCYKVAEKIYMCNIAFQTKAEVPANTWLIRFPENILSSGVEGYCVMHCTDRTAVPATLLLQIGGSASFNQLVVKTNPFPNNKYYFGSMILIQTA